MPSALVLVMDGLGAGQLGPLGNTWIDTPAFNRLATESVLAEQAWAVHADPAQGYDSIWRATDAMGNVAADFAASNLLSQWSSRGIVTKLLTDDPDLIDHRLAAEFAEQIELEVPPERELASAWVETHAARFFAEAISVIQQLPNDAVLWMHTRALGNPWDAPMAYRQQFADDDDPNPSDSPAVPQLKLAADYDPDDLHSIQCACAGQVVLLDQCLGVLLAVVQEIAAAREMLFVVTSMRGFPLGEHLVVGWDEPCLYRELLHVPMFLRYPDSRYAMRRAAGLVEPRDLTQLLSNWISNSTEPSPTALPLPTREFSISRNATELLLRTRAWHARFPRTTDDLDADVAASQLFLKPDDQAEVNDVSNRCPQVAEAAWRFLRTCLADPAAGDRLLVPDILREPPV